jgi:methylated-DNA-[protein]-cysteine S-methyltransferase
MELFAAKASYLSPLGWINVTVEDDAVTDVQFSDQPFEQNTLVNDVLINTIRQLEEYFTGNRSEFDLKLNPRGTDFQVKVWKELLHIPFGKTVSYHEMSARIGDEKSIRAAASANGKNPIAIIIPCHRVIGSDGSLTGYAGGVEKKSWLLNHEKGVYTPTLFEDKNTIGQ